jgi:hypothetical protein
MGKAIGELLPDLFDERPAPRPGHPALETLAAARTRVEDQWKEEAAQLPAERRAGWIDTVLALETVAQLSNREEMVIYGITASNEELASCGLCSFAGFFDRRYRDHDYDVGRAKARAFLTNPQLSEAGQLGPIRYQNPEPLRAIDPRFDDLTLDRMEPGPRKQVRDRLARRAHDVLAQLHVGDAGPIGGIVRSTIVGALVRPQLNKLLKL